MHVFGCFFLTILGCRLYKEDILPSCKDSVSARESYSASLTLPVLERLRGGKGAYGAKMRRNIKFRKFMYQVDGDYYVDDDGKFRWEKEEEEKEKGFDKKLENWERDQKLRNFGKEFTEHLACVEYNQRLMEKKTKSTKDLELQGRAYADQGEEEEEEAEEEQSRKRARIIELRQEQKRAKENEEVRLLNDSDGGDIKTKNPPRKLTSNDLGIHVSSSSTSPSPSCSEEEE